MKLQKKRLKNRLIATLPIVGFISMLCFPLMTGSVVSVAPAAFAQSSTATKRVESSTSRELAGLLREFLDNAARGDRAGFEKFFADGVIYTRSTGVVINKRQILEGIERLKPTDESKTTYTAEDIVIHDYGDTAVVAFRLVAQTQRKNAPLEKTNYRNTGTFLRRNSVWQVVAWQSTKISVPSLETSR